MIAEACFQLVFGRECRGFATAQDNMQIVLIIKLESRVKFDEMVNKVGEAAGRVLETFED